MPGEFTAKTQLSGDCDAVAFDELLESIDLLPESTSEITILKRTDKNHKLLVVFRYESEHFPPMVVKYFSLSSFDKRLFYRRYATHEYDRLQRAVALDLSVPRPFALHKSHNRIGALRTTVLMEAIHPARSLQELLTKETTLMPTDIMQSVASLLRSLYLAGANHIDLSPENILIREQTGEAVLIDWQYANFLKPQSHKQLLMQTARLFQYLSREYPALHLQDNIHQLFGLLECSTTLSDDVTRTISLVQSKLSKWTRYHV